MTYNDDADQVRHEDQAKDILGVNRDSEGNIESYAVVDDDSPDIPLEYEDVPATEVVPIRYAPRPPNPELEAKIRAIQKRNKS